MTSHEIDIQPSTADDIKEFYQGAVDKTLKAFTVRRRGEIVAIAGIVIERDKLAVFSDIKEGVTAPSITIWRVAKRLMALIENMHLPIMAIANDDRPQTDKFLRRLGFVYRGICNEGKVYKLWVN